MHTVIGQPQLGPEDELGGSQRVLDIKYGVPLYFVTFQLLMPVWSYGFLERGISSLLIPESITPQKMSEQERKRDVNVTTGIVRRYLRYLRLNCRYRSI